MPRKPQAPEPAPPTTWVIYKLAAKQTWVGTVQATDEREAIETAAKEFKVGGVAADGGLAPVIGQISEPILALAGATKAPEQ